MMRFGLACAALLACLSFVSPRQASAAAEPGTAARPAADVARDPDRKPAQTLKFSDVRPGERILELVPGGGYFTRLLSTAVGPAGHVYAWLPPRPENAPAQYPDFAAMANAVVADPAYGNVTIIQQSLGKVDLGAPVSLVFTAQNYHDMHNVAGLDLRAFNRAVYERLEAGGEYVILDHSAQPGSGARDTSTLHRIDAATVKEEVLAAGFEFVAASDLLANPGDPRTGKVFDPAIRGKTDQFLLKFRKPKS